MEAHRDVFESLVDLAEGGGGGGGDGFAFATAPPTAAPANVSSLSNTTEYFHLFLFWVELNGADWSNNWFQSREYCDYDGRPILIQCASGC